MATGRLGPLLSLLLLILLTSREARCQECSNRCRCSNSRVDCSNSELTWGPRPLPPDTRVLNLENNALKMVFPRTFEPLPSLEELRLTGNKIKAIHDRALAIFPRLLKLDASRNEIQNVQRQGLAGLGELKTLSFSNNDLRNVARIFSVTPALQQVNLAFNRIRYITDKDFEATTRIYYLDLQDNALTNINARAFARLGSLRYLLLNNNPLELLPALTFPANSMLQILDLNHCRLQGVPRGLPASITDLRLSHNRLDSLGASDLQGLPRLRLAALNDNNISSIHPECFSGLPQLAEVWLRSNKLRQIPPGLPATVRKLFLDSNLVSELPSQAFPQDSRLQQLTMQGNKLEHIVSTALQGLNHLETVSFQGNMIQQLTPGTFSSLPNLTSLVLSNNPLGDVQPGAFRDLPALRDLSLSYAESHGGGGDQVHMEAAVLAEMPALTRLDMMNSPRLTAAFLQSLVLSSPSPHSSLQELDLSYNDLVTLPQEVKDAFPRLTRLNLEGNPWLCDRSLLWLKHWMLEGSVSFFVADPPACEEPFNLKGAAITEVPDDQFAEVRVIAPDSQQPPDQNTGGLTEELAPSEGQGSEVEENREAQTDQPPLNDQGPLYQPIGGQAYGRPQEAPDNSASSEALAILRPDEGKREEENKAPNEDSVTAQEDPSRAKDVQVQHNAVTRTPPKSAVPQQANAVKKSRGQKGGQRKGRGRKQARKGKKGKGHKNRKQRQRRRRRHDGKRGQRKKSRANAVLQASVKSDAGGSRGSSATSA